MASKKRIERWCVGHVAAGLGGSPVDEAGEWPDGWVVTPSERIPVEIVDACERLAGEDPTAGSAWRPAYKKAEREATAIEKTTGVPVGFGAHGGAGFVVPLDGAHQMPVRLKPIKPVDWVLSAIQQKIGKHYSDVHQTVLGVRLVGIMPLYPWELTELGTRLDALGWPFREVWLINEFGEPPQVVPGPGGVVLTTPMEAAP